MSQQSFRTHRCRTQLGHHPQPTSLRLKCHSHQPQREPLTQQAKFINPYSKDKPNKKSILRFQEPHSVVLLQRKHQKTANEARMNTHVGADQPEKERYKMERVIGKGCNSVVFEGFCEGESQRVAIKKIMMGMRGQKCSQAELMQSLDHPNVVKLKEQYETIDRGRKFQCLVMERFDCDLSQLIRQKWLSQDEVKSYAYQILASLEYLHRESVVHRDIKPANIFINRREKRAVLGDLGSAKKISFGELVSGQPCPFTYRAPELLFGGNSYSHSADMWSFACILMELATGESPFKANSSTELLMQVINRLGTPSVQQICEMDPNYNPRSYEQLPKVRPKRDGIFSSQPQLNDLLKRIFAYSPERRITAFEALQHEYFKETRMTESLRTEESMTTPMHKRDRSNLNTVASLQDQTVRSTKTAQRPRQTLLKAYLGKMKAQHPLARNLAF